MPAWQPHPEVWLLIAGLVALGVYAQRVVEPSAVAAGHLPITSAQRRWFVAAVALMWFASDWPMHDVSEERLYLVHMVQHLLYTGVIAPMLLLASPPWLIEFLIGNGATRTWFFRLGRPLPAAIIYNSVVAVTHWKLVVNTSVENGPFHYLVHTVVVVSALIVWLPVCSPIVSMRVSYPSQMFHIFLMSIIPTVPAAFLTVADGVLYSAYDHGPRMWGMSVIHDQQMAGVIMKVVAGFYLWGIIFFLFLKWVRSDTESAINPARKRGRLVVDGRIIDDSAADLTGESTPAASASSS